MTEKLKKALYVLWVLWIVVFCLATFTKIEVLAYAKNWFLLVLASVDFLYLGTYFIKTGCHIDTDMINPL